MKETETKYFEFEKIEGGYKIITNNINDNNINIVIPSKYKNEPVTSIGEGAFYSCRSLTSVEIPSSVISIGQYAFYDCNSLTSVTFGANSKLTSIGNSAFERCSSLTSVETPSSVTSIGERAFWYCKSLNDNYDLTNIQKIKTVKGLNFDPQTNLMYCRDFVYKTGETYETNAAELCKYGFHACLNGLDVFNYYAGKDVVYYEVELSNLCKKTDKDSKICGKKIKLLRQLTVAEAANYRSIL